jgi:hypothetical protein
LHDAVNGVFFSERCIYVPRHRAEMLRARANRTITRREPPGVTLMGCAEGVAQGRWLC